MTGIRGDVVSRICPECGMEMWVWSGEATSLHRIPLHGPTQSPCWISGVTWEEAREMIRMRTENGGALLRAAHP